MNTNTVAPWVVSMFGAFVGFVAGWAPYVDTGVVETGVLLSVPGCAAVGAAVGFGIGRGWQALGWSFREQFALLGGFGLLAGAAFSGVWYSVGFKLGHDLPTTLVIGALLGGGLATALLLTYWIHWRASDKLW